MLCLVLAPAAMALEPGAANMDPPVSPGDLGFDRVAWTVPLGELNEGASPVWCDIDGNDLFVVDSKHVFHCIDRTSGIHRWIVNLPGALTHDPGISDDVVGLVARDHIILADRFTGSRRLDKKLKIFPSTTPAVTKDSVYTGVFIEKRLQALGGVSGMEGWSFRFRDFVTVAPRILGEGVEQFLYAAANDGAMVCLPVKAALGAPPAKAVWTARTSGGITKDFTAAGDHIFVVSDDSSLYAMHRLTGRVTWRHYAGVPILDSVQADGNRVFMRTRDGFYCLDSAEGKKQWSFETGHMVAALTEDTVYVWTVGDRIAIVDLETGEVKKEVEPKGEASVIPGLLSDLMVLVDGDTVYGLVK
jgi:outer membrane protein assembly factor BamB